MFDPFSMVNSKGEELWMDFISTFYPHSIDLWPKVLTYKWCNFSRSRNVHFGNGRETSRSKVIKRLLLSKSHIPVNLSLNPETGPLEEDVPSHNYLFPKPLNPDSPPNIDCFRN